VNAQIRALGEALRSRPFVFSFVPRCHGLAPRQRLDGTAFEPIYTVAARGDFDRSALFFGQFVWYVVMKRPERWASGRYQLDGKDIRSRTYFRSSR
jgi:hypothetical protein